MVKEVLMNSTNGVEQRPGFVEFSSDYIGPRSILQNI
jgi:hypothetical protein